MFKRKPKDNSAALTPKQRIWREIKGYAEAIIIALIVTTFFFTTVGVAGPSMYPPLEGGPSNNLLQSFFIGDRLFVPKYETWLKRIGIGEYQRGDVIIFREPQDKPCRRGAPGRLEFIVKRLIGLPGDHVRVATNGSVWINDKELDQSFITDLEQGHILPTMTADMIVPEGNFFIMGDNRPESCDSRMYGTIPFISVAGKVSAVIWPPVRHGKFNWQAIKPPAAFEALNR
jgi:signal peptidase I